MTLIGLTGGIASGKSTIARRLSELGAVHIDADQLAREAVAVGSPGLARLRARFGDQILDAHGALDRAQLAGLVFSDAEALADLNAIVHPEVRRLAEQRIADATSADPAAIVVYDVPLLVESAHQLPWDLVVVAEAPPATRVERMVAIRGMDAAEARKRIANQASDAERRAVADVVIDTGGTEQETIQQTDRLWSRLSSAGTLQSSRVPPEQRPR